MFLVQTVANPLDLGFTSLGLSAVVPLLRTSSPSLSLSLSLARSLSQCSWPQHTLRQYRAGHRIARS
eukprot:3119339-Rhodomonas_salina.1